MTVQLEALSVVHTYYADEEKCGLKRKLAVIQNDLTDAQDKTIAFESLVEETHERSRRKMYKVLTKLVVCQETGELTNADLREMVSNLQDAHNGLHDCFVSPVHVD